MYYSTELYHYGIKGMKWGVRRYRNEDGTLTNAGKKRYGTDLDINDKSRRNIAKIRKGEAYRRLDVAKENNPTNYTRIAELQGRVRGAKQAEKQAKRIDRGAKLSAKGQTIRGNNLKKAVVNAGAYVAANVILPKMLNHSLKNLYASGQYRQGHYNAAKALQSYGTIGIYSLAFAYDVKKSADNRAIRSFQNARASGASTIKTTGSTEYADVLKRRKKEG